ARPEVLRRAWRIFRGLAHAYPNLLGLNAWPARGPTGVEVRAHRPAERGAGVPVIIVDTAAAPKQVGAGERLVTGVIRDAAEQDVDRGHRFAAIVVRAATEPRQRTLDALHRSALSRRRQRGRRGRR